MARVVGGALLVRMFLPMFLILILVSVVSLFTYTGVLFIPTLYLSDLQGSLQKCLIDLKVRGSTIVLMLPSPGGALGRGAPGRLFWRWVF